MLYFSDREFGSRARNVEEIDDDACRGLLVVVGVRRRDGSFGVDYPELCPDPGRGVTGSGDELLRDAVRGHNLWWLDDEGRPTTYQLLDLLEFCHGHVGMPIARGHHGFFGHDHLVFDREKGQEALRDEVNQ